MLLAINIKITNIFFSEQWPKSPYINDYQSKIDKDDMDVDAEASQFGEGIKARVPRVNFITQQSKGKDNKAYPYAFPKALFFVLNFSFKHHPKLCQSFIANHWKRYTTTILSDH